MRGVIRTQNEREPQKEVPVISESKHYDSQFSSDGTVSELHIGKSFPCVFDDSKFIALHLLQHSTHRMVVGVPVKDVSPPSIVIASTGIYQGILQGLEIFLLSRAPVKRTFIFNSAKDRMCLR